MKNINFSHANDAKASQNKDPTKAPDHTNGYSSTPNDHGAKESNKDTLDMTKRDLQRFQEAKTSQIISKKDDEHMYKLTDYNKEATEEPSDQQTLLGRLCSDQGRQDQDEGTSGISLHGPSHRGPRVLLTNHQEGPRIG